MGDKRSVIGVLSDIHGNEVALKAVLDTCRSNGVERLFLLGDLVGYYYHPGEVLNLLSSWQVDMIQGNHEDLLRIAVSDPEKAAAIRSKYGSGIEVAFTQLHFKEIAHLTSLPHHRIIRASGTAFKLCHGAPWDRDYYVYADAAESILERCAEVEADFVLMGHTHHAFALRRGDTFLINAGSVGQARDHGGIASWVLIDEVDRTFELQRTPYRTDLLIEEAKSRDPDVPYLHTVLTR